MPSAAKRRAFYDRFGARQDRQGWYEDVALEALAARLDPGDVRRVVEAGCGTGRFAEQLLEGVLARECTYAGYDVSETMVQLARTRLARFGARVNVGVGDATAVLPEPDGGADLVIATYLLDLLDEAETIAFLAEARRLLRSDGRLALVGLTRGHGPIRRAVSGLWRLVHRLAPLAVGGCRPLDLKPTLEADRWRIVSAQTVSAWAIASHVIIAEPRQTRRIEKAAGAGPAAFR